MRRRTDWKSVGRQFTDWLAARDLPYSAPNIEALAHGSGIPVLGPSLSRLVRSGVGISRHIGLQNSSVRLASLAIRLHPDNALNWILLSEACRVSGPRGVVYENVRGLVEGAIGDQPTACASAARATLLEPSDASTWLELGRCNAASHRAEAARSAYDEAIRLDPTRADVAYERARVEAASATARGYFTIAEFAAHERHASHALMLSPEHQHARYHLIRVALRAGHWSTAMNAAMGEQPLPAAIDQLFDVSSNELDPANFDGLWSQVAEDLRLPSEVWLVLYWRHIDAGALRSAYIAKDRYASEILMTSSVDAGPASQMNRARALLQLERVSEALEELGDAIISCRSSRARHALELTLSDVAMTQGDLERHRSGAVPDPLIEVERRFGALLNDANVAIVGPTTAGDYLEEIDQHDVILRPKSLGSNDLARTDVAYFANASAALLSESIAAALHDGDLQWATFRPTLHGQGPRALLAASRTRYAPRECSAFLEASPYGISRMVFDVLRFRPRTVRIFNTDFFTSGRKYDAGYQSERATSVGAAFRENVVGYGHDLRADHKHLAALLDTGSISGTSEVENILRLSTAEYLERVSHAARASITS